MRLSTFLFLAAHLPAVASVLHAQEKREGPASREGKPDGSRLAAALLHVEYYDEAQMVVAHDCPLQEGWCGPSAGVVIKPAAVTHHALKWPKPYDGKPPPGWHEVEVSGWLVNRGKEGRQHMLHEEGHWWLVKPQGMSGDPAAYSLNLHATFDLNAGNIVATLSEGIRVYVDEQREIDGREWFHCSPEGWLNDGSGTLFDPYNPGESYEASLTLPTPGREPVVSHRIFTWRNTHVPVEMSFTNHREKGGLDTHGRALLEGTWTGMTFVSHSQKMLDGYKNWINETMVVNFGDNNGRATVSVEFKRRGDTVRAQADMHYKADAARKSP